MGQRRRPVGRIRRGRVSLAPPAARHEMSDERERAELVLHTQLSLARRHAAPLLPTVPPAADGFEWAATLIPAGRIGGDFYDFVERAPGMWLMLVADVSGKGIPAAMALGVLRSTFRRLARPARLGRHGHRDVCGALRRMAGRALRHRASSPNWTREPGSSPTRTAAIPRQWLSAPGTNNCCQRAAPHRAPACSRLRARARHTGTPRRVPPGHRWHHRGARGRPRTCARCRDGQRSRRSLVGRWHLRGGNDACAGGRGPEGVRSLGRRSDSRRRQGTARRRSAQNARPA